ncbi:MAG TPA: hypothetical protein DCG69_07600 [Bacteroidales bacterium]|nr:hypothetical protein [Bacteroidales bacterium]
MLFENKSFKQFSLAFFILLLLSSPLLFVEKEFLNLWLNKQHNPVFDFICKYSVYLGDGLVLMPLFLLLLSRSYFLSLIFSVSALLELLFVQLVLKWGFFKDVVRPLNYIEQSDLLYKVEGVDIHMWNSFPSGHTQTAFLAVTFLVLLSRRLSLVYVYLFLATVVALTRVYLLQHFFIDVWFGALIGYLFPVIILLLFKKFSSLSENKKWQKGFLS